jgi:hypothetical protein
MNVESPRATERATGRYDEAMRLFITIWSMKGRNEIDSMSMLAGMARALSFDSLGHQEMATGLRATYLKLEEIDRRLARIEGTQRR